MKTQTTLSLLIALSASMALTGCEDDPFGKFIQNVGGTDTIGQMRDSGPYTAGSAVVEEIIVAEQTPAPEPPCEDIRWRYVIYDCHWNPKGSYE
jgi:hypothetical protein